MALPPRLEMELEGLRITHAIEVIEEPELINLIFKDFDLGEGFNISRCDILVRIPRSYPEAGPDMFWTNPELTLANGQIPQAAEHMEDYISKRWRRFSWHRQPWNPTVDNILVHLEFIRRRLREKK